MEIAIAARFGLTALTDLYFVIAAVPWVVSRSIAATAAGVLVPTLHAHRAAGRRPLVGLLRIQAIVLVGASILALLLWSVWGPVTDSGIVEPIAVPLAGLLVLAHAVAVSTELLRADLIALQRGTLAAASDVLQFAVAAAIILLAPFDSILLIPVALLIGSCSQFGVILVSLKADITGSGVAVGVRQLWSECGVDLLRTASATAGRRLTIPVERAIAASILPGAASAITYAGQATNAFASLFGLASTTHILPHLSAERDVHARALVLEAWLKWFALVGLFVAFGSTVLCLQYEDLARASPVFAPYEPITDALPFMIWALPGMLFVQAGLASFFARSDRRETVRHMILTTVAHMTLLALVAVSPSLPLIAACWPVAGVYSLVRAARRMRKAGFVEAGWPELLKPILLRSAVFAVAVSSAALMLNYLHRPEFSILVTMTLTGIAVVSSPPPSLALSLSANAQA